ncbi:hypothetical protein T11_12241 [Trichinella zimbabwensis]|uniref:Uncharacterized protein n=1 Tax=Trichinella zimbabwensis TaxID=268475 RepID=A0A0V1GV52_9BILA|nr:hypothetical protein T11_12241 [Trichinella zimbabwensis]
MDSVPDFLEERFHEWYSGVTAPRKYLVLVDCDRTNSETEEFDAESPKLTEAQLEAGVKSQKFKMCEESQRKSAQDGTNSEADGETMEEFQCKLKLCIVCFFLLGFAAALWLSCLLLCRS